MPGFSLNADFDRNGRMDGRQAERDARNQGPGAILLPNLDNDSRSLPGSVAASAPVQLDASRTAKTANDNELRPVALIPETGATLPCDVFLSLTGWSPGKISVLDGHRRVLSHSPGSFNTYTFGNLRARSDLFLEARTLAGSPLNRFQSLQTSFGQLQIDERNISVSLTCRDAVGREVGTDFGRFTIASWLMIDNGSPIEKLFICDVGDNLPSVNDVRDALPNPAVLVTVPGSVANGDAWLQDQFEVGFCHAPEGVRKVVLHLPRLRSNVTARTATQNLAAFVRGHLPSRDIGLFDDFWNRSVPVTDVNNQRVDIPFSDSGAVAAVMSRVYQLRGLLLFVSTEVLSQTPLLAASGRPIQPERFPRFVRALRDVTQWAPLVTAALVREAGVSGLPAATAALLNTHRADVSARSSAVTTAITLGTGSVTVSAGSWSAELTFDLADELYLRLDQMHHSSNYGGNIELGPPVPGAPLGKIVIGNVEFERADFVDPDLKRFLSKQLVQPLVEIRTEWLGVGHVDEVAAFVPARDGHAILLASPDVGLRILRMAAQSYAQGLPPAQPYLERPDGTATRRMTSGLHPVTMMLRGKDWVHVQQPGSQDINEPPLTYIRLVNWYARQMVNIHAGTVRFTPGPGGDRTYAAAISVKETLWIDGLRRHARPNAQPDDDALTTNEYIEEEFMTENFGILSEAFPEVPILSIPVLYDFVADMNFVSTRAFLPNAVNLVVVGDRLLIPQQFGPRMRVADAITVILAVFDELGTRSLGAGLNDAWVRRQGMVGVNQWFRGAARSSDPGVNAMGLAEMFADGFPGIAQDEVARRIKRANSSAFRGDDLRSGWHKLTIPEDTVDLFELHIARVVHSLGLHARFVDSWYYHLNHGEIHCGTNALRTPVTRSRPQWWTL